LYSAAVGSAHASRSPEQGHRSRCTPRGARLDQDDSGYPERSFLAASAAAAATTTSRISFFTMAEP